MNERYILASPRWLQYGVLSVALVSGFVAFVRVARLAYEGPIGAGHTLLGGLSLVVLVAVANVKLWRRWIHAVIDRNGLWLPTRRGELLKVRWANVGRVTATPHRFPAGGLRVYVNLAEERWKLVSWRHPNDHPEADATLPAGFRPLRLGALGHDRAALLRAIEHFRD